MCARAGTASRGGEGGGIGGGDPRHAGRHVHADVADLDALPAHTYFILRTWAAVKVLARA